MSGQTRKVAILPQTEKRMQTMGEQIRLARLRRKLSASLVAERAGISRQTLWKVEKGDPGVAMGIYAKVLILPDGMDMADMANKYKDKLEEYIQPVTTEEIEHFFGKESEQVEQVMAEHREQIGQLADIDLAFERLLSENEDVLKRLKERE